METGAEPTNAAAPSRLTITGSHGDGRPLKHESAGPRIVIGRAPDSNLRLNHDTVSRHHAELVRDPFGRWWVRDLGSRNGTKVNGRTSAETLVRDGDIVKVGRYELRLGIAASESTAGDPAMEMTVAPEGRDREPSFVHGVEDTADVDVVALDVARSPSISASHLDELSALGQQLNSTEEEQQRLQLLCDWTTSPGYRGLWSMVLRRSLANGEDASLQILCKSASRTPRAGTEEYVSRTLVECVLKTNLPALATNAQNHASGAIEMSLDPNVMRISAIACPLRAAANSLELLYVVLPAECGVAEWLALGSLAAKQHQQSESSWRGRADAQAHASIESDLRQARDIQMRLVPQAGSVAGLDTGICFQPCKWVSGDYVDVLRTPDGKVLVAVADVCGKGTQAALLASSVHTLVRANVRARLGLADSVESINEHLMDFLPAGSFVTMFLALVNPLDGNLQYVNAGHPAGVIVERGGDWVELATGANVPLGIEPTTFSVQTAKLSSGSFLAVYTDGWTELRNGGGELLGFGRFLKSLRDAVQNRGPATSQQMADKIVADLDLFREQCLPGDDRTLLLCRRAEASQAGGVRPAAIEAKQESRHV
jgi:serine phosphatase RsbU (regulator of sigma subunit)